MTKPIIVEGKTVLVPDDATPEEMLQIANEHAAPVKAAPAAKPQGEPSIFNNPFLTGVKEAAEPMGSFVGGIGDVMGAGMRAMGIPTRDTSKPLPRNVTVPGQFLTPGTVAEDSYKPTTAGGRYIETLGQFAPTVGLGPAGAAGKIISVALPAIASQTGRELFRGTSAEPYAGAVGALIGGLPVGAVSRGAKSLANALEMGAPVVSKTTVDEIAPTIEDIHNTATTNYNALRDPEKNPIIKTDKLKELKTQIRDVLAENSFSSANHPQTARLWKTVQGLPQGKAIEVDPALQDEIESIFGPGTATPEEKIPAINGSTLRGLETVRQQAVNAGRDFRSGDGFLANKVKGVISKFMSDLDPQTDIIGTEATGPISEGATNIPGLANLQEARSAWSTMKKAQTIQSIIDNADIRGAANYTQAGSDTALRRGFANLATNSKKMAQFSPEEQDAIIKVAKGGPMTNILRGIGKFAIRGPVSGFATHAVGSVLGPLGPYVLAGAAEAAKAGGASGTENSINQLNALVRGGPESLTRLKDLKKNLLVEGLKNYLPASMGAAGLIGQQQ